MCRCIINVSTGKMSIRAETPMLAHTMHAYNITVSDEAM